MTAILRWTSATLLAGFLFLGLSAMPTQAAVYRHPIRRDLERQTHRVENRMAHGVGNPAQRHLLQRDWRWLRWY